MTFIASARSRWVGVVGGGVALGHYHWVTGRCSAAELRDVTDPAWPEVQGQIAASPLPVEVIAADLAARDTAIEELQVTARSVMGALVSECGGLTVDHGWLRILGAGADGLPSIRSATDLVAVRGNGLVVVAIDVLGGYFAVNGGDLPGELGEVGYWGPDTLDWNPLGLGHAGFVQSMLGGAVCSFYESLRWPGWEEEVQAVPLDHGLSVYPLPFTKEGHDLAFTSRRPVPLTELIGLYADLAAQVHQLPDETEFRLNISD